MTISYNLDVASSSSWSFLKIIFRWKGSIWKSVLTELCIWTFFYYVVFCIYRFLLCDEHQRSFALFAFHLDEKLHYIPLTFLLGFFVTIVVDRWKNIFANIGFIDNAAFFVGAYVRGSDEETKTIRRNIVRYLCLTQVLILRDISIQVRKRLLHFVPR
ncbi:bestrophin, RFP-TM, chloride channel domain-containing protein [Ditylenchus destructor]|nr:bestrophin, RFP-TM, chloride channel domain-containing protein [Ditylenchus destructor]